MKKKPLCASRTVPKPIVMAATIIIAIIAGASYASAGQQLWSSFTLNPPKIDGSVGDTEWQAAKPVITKDGASGIEITLRSMHSQTSIYFLVTFPDADESRRHRPWIWNHQSSRYEVGPDREDCFVFKWFMGNPPKDIHIDSDEPHTADTWFWKARRTDPVGYADDKIQLLTRQSLKKSMKIRSRSGKLMFLQRKGDQGQAAYRDRVFVEYTKDVMPRFENLAPAGSRADIRAKGSWQNGSWTIEFSRKLETGHADDIQMDRNSTYSFGVSRYEIAGRAPDYATSQPLYGAGRLGERLVLKFLPKP